MFRAVLINYIFTVALFIKLFNGMMRGIEAAQSIEGLKKRLDIFYSRVREHV